MLQEARSEAPGQFKPTTLREEMLSARSDSRRAHNENIYHVIPVTGAAIDGRQFSEGKASSCKEIAPGVFVPFTVAGITMKDGGPKVVVAVNPHGHKYFSMLVHHTGAAVVRITVASIHATHGVSEQQRTEPLYLVLALNDADVVADLAYTTPGGGLTGTYIPVHIIAAALKGADREVLSNIAWRGSYGPEARATDAFKEAVRKGLCRRDQVAGVLDPILRAHVQTLRAQSEKLWAGQAGQTWADVARGTASAQARPLRAAQDSDSDESSDSDASDSAESSDSDASSSSSATSSSSSSSPGDGDSNATPKKQGTSKRGSKKSGRKGQDKARVRRG